MRYYSTNHESSDVTLREAIMHSNAPDGGLYLPRDFKRLPSAFFNNIQEMSKGEISYFVSNTLFGEELPSSKLKQIGDQAFSFPMPLVQIEPNIFAMELYHGPTMTFKDMGARYLARLHAAINPDPQTQLNVLVASNGNSGTAIANGFHMVKGINVFALFPKDVPEHIAQHLFSLGNNVHALRVNGNIDDCRKMVSLALDDNKLNETISFTCANTLNIGRVLPQSICYFMAFAMLRKQMPELKSAVYSVPTGNGGNLLAGYIAKQMGLPISRLIAACNGNGAFARYLNGLEPIANAHSLRTLAYAMDTCMPANLARFNELCGGNVAKLSNIITASICTDDQIRQTIIDTYQRTGYMLDPHSAVAYFGLKSQLRAGETGIIMATGHPARSASIMEKLLGVKIEHQSPFRRSNMSIAAGKQLHPTYPALKKYILQTQTSQSS